MKTKRSKATDIPMSVKKKVWERDNGCCVVCGNSYNVMPNSHILKRSNNGRGIETNIVTMCTNFTPNKCHYKFDFGTREERQEILDKVVRYMKSIYGEDWSIEKQRYSKWED